MYDGASVWLKRKRNVFDLERIMSHVVSLKIEIRNLDAVKAVCNRFGWELREGQNTYAWWSNWVDDSPVPEELLTALGHDVAAVKAMPRPERQKLMESILGKCDHAIRIPDCKFEVGLVKAGERYIPVWDWANGQMARAMGRDGGAFAQQYGIELTRIEAARKGWSVQEQRLDNGAVKLVLSGVM